MDECSTVEITRIAEEVNYLLAIVAASQDPNNSDRTTTIESDAFESLSDELASAIDKDNTTILPNDLRNTIESVVGLLRYTTVSTCTYINHLSWIMVAHYILNYIIIILLKAAQYVTCYLLLLQHIEVNIIEVHEWLITYSVHVMNTISV